MYGRFNDVTIELHCHLKKRSLFKRNRSDKLRLPVDSIFILFSFSYRSTVFNSEKRCLSLLSNIPQGNTCVADETVRNRI